MYVICFVSKIKKKYIKNEKETYFTLNSTINNFLLDNIEEHKYSPEGIAREGGKKYLFDTLLILIYNV